MTNLLICTRCTKPLSRKRAREIGGEVVCSPCMFGQEPLMSSPCRAAWQANKTMRYRKALDAAQGIEARSDETVQPAQPVGREPDGEADAPKA